MESKYLMLEINYRSEDMVVKSVYMKDDNSEEPKEIPLRAYFPGDDKLVIRVEDLLDAKKS